MTFGMAFDSLTKNPNAYMRLPQWKEDVKIKIQTPDEHSKMTSPYLYVESRFGNVPWKETMIELFSKDWEVGGKIISECPLCKKENVLNGTNEDLRLRTYLKEDDLYLAVKDGVGLLGIFNGEFGTCDRKVYSANYCPHCGKPLLTI